MTYVVWNILCKNDWICVENKRFIAITCTPSRRRTTSLSFQTQPWSICLICACISLVQRDIYNDIIISNIEFFIFSFFFMLYAVYRIYTAILFHGSLLHVMFNMLALVPLGSELERVMGSIRLLYIIILLATSNAILHLLVALLVAYNPFHPYENLMNECAIGFSGVLFSMIVIETGLSGVQSRRFVLIIATLNINILCTL